jgi:hypothetical protein
MVSGNASLAASAAVWKPGKRANPQTDRNSIAKWWQIEAYRFVNLIGEARFSAVLFSNMAGRAEIGISEPQALVTQAHWITSGPEVEALAELAPTVRERTKLIRDYMLHRTIAGECYLIARKRVDTDPGYIAPPEEFDSWEAATQAALDSADVLDPDFDPDELDVDPNEPIWEIVAVTELQRTGDGSWKVRHDNDNWLALSPSDPVIRMWNPDPERRREAWSPFRAGQSTLREIEWLTKHIFTQVRSRLLSAGVWFLPENLTFPPPPPEAVEGGEEAIAAMNEAELFMLSLAASGMQSLDDDEVSFPSIVMADAAALAAVDQNKLIKFWSEIDDKAMTLRSDAIRRWALGMDLPPEQVLGSSGVAISGSGGSAGSVNHWGEWAKEEQTIQNHVEPALDDFVGTLTWAFLRAVVPATKLVVGYDTASLRLKQDKSKESIELHDRGLLNAARTLRENGFDPENDLMDEDEFKRWVLVKMIGGSPTPEQVAEAVKLLTGLFMPIEVGAPSDGGGRPGRHEPGNLDQHPVKGPPQGDHEHQDAPYGALLASCEGLVLRALDKAGNRLLNDGKRGKDRDRTTPPFTAHTLVPRMRTYIGRDFDFSTADVVLNDLPPAHQRDIVDQLGRFCADLYNLGQLYDREGLSRVVRG